MGETSLRLVRDAGTGWDGLCAGVFTATGTNVLRDVAPKNPACTLGKRRLAHLVCAPESFHPGIWHEMSRRGPKGSCEAGKQLLLSVLPVFVFWLFLSLPSSCDPMGRKRWTDDPQHAFLQGFLAGLDPDKEPHGLKPFYERVTKAFIERWVSPAPPGLDPNSVDEAEFKRLADEHRGVVSSLSPFPSCHTHSYGASKS